MFVSLGMYSERKVIVLHECYPSGLSASEFLQFSEILQVLVVGPDLDWFLSA
jgi:hypothetical protein